MSSFNLYLLLKMDSFSCIAWVLSGIFFGIVVIMFIIWGFFAKEAYSQDDTAWIRKIIRNHIKLLLSLSLIFLITALLIPSTKQMAAIIVVPKVISSIESNKELMSIPGEVISLASAWIKDLRPENIKESAKTVKQQAKECKPVESNK